MIEEFIYKTNFFVFVLWKVKFQTYTVFQEIEYCILWRVDTFILKKYSVQARTEIIKADHIGPPWKSDH